MKKLVLLVLLACFGFAASAQSTLVTLVSNTSLCADSVQPVSVSYSDAVTTFQPGNVFTVQLSDPQGAFTNPLAIGSLAGTASSGIIQALVPTWAAGNGYRIRVVSSAPAITGSDNGTDLTIVPLPQVWVSPSQATICPGGIVWFSAQANTPDLTWTPASSIVSTSGSAISVMPGVSTTYTATAYNSCGTATATAEVNVTAFANVFRETMGQVASSTPISIHFAADGFDNLSPIYHTGTGQVRSTFPSTNYAGASGAANVFLNQNNATNTYMYAIEGVNTFGMNDLSLSFGLWKNTNASNGSELALEASTDGGSSFAPISFNALPTGTNTANKWYYVSTTSPIPSAQSLIIRFRQTSTNTQFRVDDVELTNGTVAAPTITSSGPISGACFGSAINLTASGGTSFAWSNGATTQIIPVTQNGSYSVAVTNGSGCTATSNPVVVNISGPPLPMASNNGPVCEGQPVTLSVSGDPSFDYSWVGPNSFTSTQQNPTIANATQAISGMYTVLISMPGCPPVAVTTPVSVSPVNFTVSANSTGPICEGGTLSLFAPFIAGATYSWIGPNSFTSNDQNPTIPNVTPSYSGTYSVFVTTACSVGSASVSLTVHPQPIAPGLSANSVCEGQTLWLNASPLAGGTFTWTGPAGQTWIGQNQTIPNATPTLHSGLYTAVVTTPAGCVSQASTIQAAVLSNNPSVGIASNLPVCPGSTLMLTAMGGMAGPYTWSGPNNFSDSSQIVEVPNLQPAHYGTYTVNYGFGSCSAMATVSVGHPGPPDVIPVIEVCPGGQIVLLSDPFFANSNSYSWIGPNGFTSNQQFTSIPNATAANTGIYTVYGLLNTCVTEPAFVQVTVSPNLTLTASTNSPLNQGGTLLLSATGSNGSYTWTGPNNFSAIGQNPYIQQVSPANAGNYTATLSSAGCTTVTAVTNVVINPMNTISGLVYNDANNNASQNAGEGPLGGVLITLQPGNYTTVTDSLGQYIAYVPDGTYTVSVAGLGTNQLSHPGNYTVTVTGSSQVSSGHNFGIHSTQVNNLMVTITELWTASPGFVTNLRLNVSNLGGAPMSGTIRFKPDAIPVLTSGTSLGYTMAADTLVWSFTNLQPGSTTYRYVHQTVPVSTPLGTVLNSTAVVTPIAGDIAPANNVYALMQTVAGSWDPNDKQVQPTGPITVQEAAAGKDLVYTIRFQNTGTAPAVNVLVVDTLSAHLNLSSFQMVASSHNYQLTMRENGILEWRFNNIMLPDSNTNEPASHGDIQYRIKTKTNLVMFDDIANTAHIFFDFNEAVVTNTTNTPVGILASPEAADLNFLHVYPNPNNGNATLRFTSTNQAETTVSVLNLLGQEVWHLNKTTEASEVEIPVDLQAQPAGIYLVRVVQDGKVYSAKLIRH